MSGGFILSEAGLQILPESLKVLRRSQISCVLQGGGSWPCRAVPLTKAHSLPRRKQPRGSGPHSLAH